MIWTMSDSGEPIEQRGFDDYSVSLGDVLRGERATMGKTLLDVQDELRIKSSYLAAIEEADASQFETPGFIAGYVRSYARYLGIDEDACFLKFCQESGFDGVNAGLAPLNESAAAAASSATLAKGGFDPFATARVPNRPKRASAFSGVSLAGVWSIFVLIALIGGLGYGGWTVLQEVQRVQITPVNDTPVVADRVTPLNQDFSQDGLSQTAPTLEVANATPALTLEDLYRPSELEVPEIVARDGAISTLDPDSLGIFAQAPVPPVPTEPLLIEAKVVQEGPPPVEVVAVNPAWIRVFTQDNTILFEKTLNKGERYRVPDDVTAPLLRAGNSGSVFVAVGDVFYGPVGVKTGVARKVSLDAEQVKQTYQVAESLDLPVGLSVNVAESQTDIGETLIQE